MNERQQAERAPTPAPGELPEANYLELGPFKSSMTRIWWLSVGGLACLHVGLLLANFSRVPLTFGYDWPGHYVYLYHVASTWSTPTAEISAQFFNPPVYYFSAAIFQRLVGLDLARAGLALNLVAALVTLTLLVALCRRLWADRPRPSLWFLGVYVLNPAVYRTIGMVRPEALLLPLTAGLLLYLLVATSSPVRWLRISLLSGLAAGLAVGIRQWGLFIEVALIVWLVLSLWPGKGKRDPWLRLGRVLTVHLAAFLLPAAFFLLVRGEGPTAFNAPLNPAPLEFVTDLELPALFSTPVRPALDNRLWPIFYADFWGDYWRYWREALGRDPLPTSSGTTVALARSMWAALPATTLMILGAIISPRTKALSSDISARVSLRWRRFAQVLLTVTIGGFALFAFLYAGSDKGDTVKSVYVVYLIPVAAWFASLGADWLSRQLRRGAWLSYAFLGLLFLFVLPNTLYQAPERWASRSWQMPEVDQATSVTFGGAYSLVGYNLEIGRGDQLEVELVWRADDYTGRSYKVFVHLLDGDGRLLAQSDAIPANWERPTQAWQLGEFIHDHHDLALPPGESLDEMRLLVGLYNERNGLRLPTNSGQDRAQLSLRSIG